MPTTAIDVPPARAHGDRDARAGGTIGLTRMSTDSSTVTATDLLNDAESPRARRPSRLAKLAAKRCPACGSTNVRRSSIRGPERDAHSFRSPYRCRVCKTRFWTVSRKARIAFGAAGLGVLVAALLVTLLASQIQFGPDPAAGAIDDDVMPMPMEFALLPDQLVNETHRLQMRATAKLPPQDRRWSKR